MMELNCTSGLTFFRDYKQKMYEKLHWLKNYDQKGHQRSIFEGVFSNKMILKSKTFYR